MYQLQSLYIHPSFTRENRYLALSISPKLNGYEATKRVRENLKSTVPNIALTANAKGENDK